MTAVDDISPPSITIATHNIHSCRNMKQTDALMAEYRAASKTHPLPTIVCGDFNAGPGSFVYKTISATLADVQLSARNTGHKRPKPTFISWFPVRRIDHIFISDDLQATAVFVPNDFECRRVSDHLPVVARVTSTSSQKTST